MESFLFLTVVAVLAVILLVIWSAVRVVKLGKTAAKVDQLERELDRVHSRLTLLEKSSAEVHAEAPRADQPRPVTSPETERVALHIRPVKPMPPPAVPPPPMQQAHVPTVSTPYRQEAVQPLQPSQAASENIPIVPSAAVARVQRTSPAAVPITADEAPTEKRRVSLEERLGQNWLNRLGIVALVTGLALLLGYKLRNLGPIGKSIMGFVISSAILVAGLLLERRNRYRIFAWAAIGGGWALLFFVAFARFHVPAMQVLHSQATDLVLMLTVACGMVVHSLRYRSQVVTSLAFLLGFLTVSISHVTMFSLVAGAVLATGLVVVAYRERWFVMVLGGLIAVYLNHALWLYRLLPNGASPGHPFPEFLPSAALLLYYWLLFRVFYIFRVPEKESDRVCSTLNVLLNSAGLLTLLKYQSSHPEWAFRGLLALGAAELVLAVVARRRHHQAFAVLACISAQAIALILLAAARTLAFNVLSPEPLAASFTEGRVFTAGLPCALFFAALPIAFSLRKQQQGESDRLDRSS